MWLQREDVKLVGYCKRCENGIHEDEVYHWHLFMLSGDKTATCIYCSSCAITAGWLPMPEETKEVATCQ